MNLVIHDFTNNNSKKIKKEYLCKKHDGNDISPKITWKNIDNVKSYALIFRSLIEKLIEEKGQRSSMEQYSLLLAIEKYDKR